MSIVIIYHSGYGHTKIVAEHIAKGATTVTPDVRLLSTEEAMADWEVLHEARALVFGSPTYMGSVSAGFKTFMEATGRFWYQQKWRDKLAAGFTNSSTLNGDKLMVLQQLSVFAAQHGMLWISTGIVPEFENDVQKEEPNGLASYLGLMTLSDNAIGEVHTPKGVATAELFGARIARLALQYTI